MVAWVRSAQGQWTSVVHARDRLIVLKGFCVPQQASMELTVLSFVSLRAFLVPKGLTAGSILALNLVRACPRRSSLKGEAAAVHVWRKVVVDLIASVMWMSNAMQPALVTRIVRAKDAVVMVEVMAFL